MSAMPRAAGYGLLLPAKKAPPKGAPKAAAVFGSDSSGDEEVPDARGNAGRAGVNYLMMQEAAKNKGSKKTQMAWNKAVTEDASVFQYDEVYDEMESKRESAVAAAAEKRSQKQQPKYIFQLMEQAKKKKLYDELRDERMAQKEREKEGAAFADLDQESGTFVTAAYKKRLVELKQLAEEERLQEAHEKANDVTKRANLHDLHRNIYMGNFDGRGEAGGAVNPPTPPGAPAGEAAPPPPRPAASATQEAAPPPPQPAASVAQEARAAAEPVAAPAPRRRSRSPPVRPAEVAAEPEADGPSKYARKTTSDAVSDARAKYLARKAARKARPLPTMEE